MKILVVGSGGREHAILNKLQENQHIEEIHVCPGSSAFSGVINTKIAAKDIATQIAYAKKHAITYAIITPDDPLALGAVDQFEAAGIPCFGPNQKAARIESSKAFSKALMKKYGIPSAGYEVFCEAEKAYRYLEEQHFPIVIKADGLALGKGVIIAQDLSEAKQAVCDMLEKKVFGEAGSTIIIEEFLSGPEVSVLAFSDGDCLKEMVSAMDHKRAYDNDEGLNTGGMGAIAPNPYYTEDIAQRCRREIYIPTLEAMKKEGCPFKGCLYFALMLTKDGPKVIEYNARFGDPETQVVLPLLESDLLSIMQACSNHTLAQQEVIFSSNSACCVVMASKGYPLAYEKGKEIRFNSEEAFQHSYLAGVKKEDNHYFSNGGRVLGIWAVEENLAMAIDRAYKRIEDISFADSFYRKDIGRKALEKE